MENNYVTLKDIINFLKKVFTFGLIKWKLLVITGFIGGIIGFGYAYFQKPIYKAQFSFLLNENDGAPALNISSLASLAGIGIGGGSGNVNDDKLMFISFSRNLLGKTLLQSADINGKKTSLANHYIEIYGLLNSFKSDTSLIGFVSFQNTEIGKLTYKENKVLDILLTKIVESKQLLIESKKKTGIVSQPSGIVTMEFTSIDENFSLNFINQLYDNISVYYTNKTISKQLRTYNIIKNRADSIKNILYTLENFGAQEIDKNLKLVRMQGKVNLERTKRDIEILSLMYAEVIKNQEIAKFALDNQTPFFQIVDSPTLPLNKKKMSKMINAIISSILLTFVVFVFSFLKNFYSIENKID